MQEKVKELIKKLPTWNELRQMSKDDMLFFAESHNLLKMGELLRKNKISFSDNVSLEQIVIFLTILRQDEERKKERKLLIEEIVKSLNDYEILQVFFDKLDYLGFITDNFAGFHYEELKGISLQEWNEIFI